MSWLFRATVLVSIAVPLLASAADSGTRAGASSQLEGKTGEWLQWRGPGRENKSTDKGLLQSWEAKPPKLQWMSEGLGEGYASVSLDADRIYTTGNNSDGQAVVALNKADGKVAWSKTLTNEPPKHGYEGSRCTPTIDGDRLYVVTSNGLIVCLKAENGDIVWQKDFKKDFDGKMMSGWGFSESPLVDGEWVLCTPGGQNAMIVALNKMTGDVIWRSAMPEIGDRGKDGAGYSSIVISNAAGVKQYVQLVGRGTIGVRASDGKFLWGYNQIANPTANIPTPIVEGDFVFTSTGYNDGGSALLKIAKDGEGMKAEEVYYHPAKTLQNHHGGMVLHDGHVYFGAKHNNGFPVCVNLKSGETVWGNDTRGPGNGSAAIVFADGNIVFRYQSGEVALIEATPEGYKLKGSFKPEYVGKNPCWAQPVVTGGKLYLRDQDKLMCYDVSK
jgi:outer membrane protein assembly factor BamB